MADYDIEKAFREVEEELMKSMIRNMSRHRMEETDEKKEWEMWQALQLKVLEEYKNSNRKKFQSRFSRIDKEIGTVIFAAREQGNMEQEIKILKAIQSGFKPPKALKNSTQTMAEFFRVNDRKLEALIKATQNDFKKAEYAMLRMAEDQYRQIIFNAQVYANTGAGTYEKAVDMATKDFLNRGINCIEYANGTRHTVDSYAAMAIRTAAKRAYLTGEGEKRKEWGITTVIMNKRGNACPKCLPFVGKVLIDDVWSGGKQSDGPYMLMSNAIAAGLYHPNCKDSHTTYFEGISTQGASYTSEELKKVEEDYRKEQKQQYAKRQSDRFNRLAENSLDEENKKRYTKKRRAWEENLEKRYAVTDDIKVHREDAPKSMISLVNKYTSDNFVVLEESSEHAFAFDPDRDVVVVNPKHQQYQFHDYRETMIHEIAHRIDNNEFGSPMNQQFSNALLETEKMLLNDIEKYKKMFDTGGILEYNELISDIIGCITDNAIVGGSYHELQYIGTPGYMELEVFADIFSALYQGDDKTVKFIKEELSHIYHAFLGIIGG